MDWDKLRIFHAVADKGSLTHAGEVLHLAVDLVQLFADVHLYNPELLVWKRWHSES